MSGPQDAAQEYLDSLGYDEVPAAQAGRRLGATWAPWMGDWFTSWSPRNNNSNAEGPWSQWVDLALQILHDPLTREIRPEVYVEGLPDPEPDDGPRLTPTQLAARFRRRS